MIRIFYNAAHPIVGALNRRPAAVLSAAVTTTLAPFSTSTTPPKVDASMISSLRKMSGGAPMMECRAAIRSVLENPNAPPAVDDLLEAALDHLRVHGGAKIASKVAARGAASGEAMHNHGASVRAWTGQGACTAAAFPDGSASLALVTTETDFAARGPDIGKLTDAAAKSAAASGTGGEVASEILLSIGGLQDALDAAVLSVREDVDIAAAFCFPSDPECAAAAYVHNKSPGGLSGAAAAVVRVRLAGGGPPGDSAIEKARLLAMHVVAARPSFCSPDLVPAEAVARERNLIEERAEQAGTLTGKPVDVRERILAGMLAKWYGECCLTDQSHMLVEGAPKVGKYLKKNGGLEVVDFALLYVGSTGKAI
mmetsp:Transcript_42938/g.84349  ORF Transcript_42938/g.84349 Transcript_42938/m.84349 type:complete len:368 (+) Transcript_42938:97-1200(+)